MFNVVIEGKIICYVILRLTESFSFFIVDSLWMKIKIKTLTL